MTGSPLPPPSSHAAGTSGATAVPSRRGAWTRWLRLGFGAALLVVLVTRVNFSELSVRWTWLLAGAATLTVALLATAQGLSAARWQALLGRDSAPWPYLYRLYLVSAFFSLFLPTAVGGDAVRAAAASRSFGQTSQMVGTVLADRTLGVLGLVSYLAIGLVLGAGPAGLGIGWQPGARSLVIAGGVALVLGFAGWAWRARLAKPIAFARGIVRAFADLARTPGRLATAVLLGFLVQAVYVAAWIALAWSLGLRVPAASFLVTVPLVSLSSMAPITLSGVGVREGAWILLLRPFGVAPADALTLSLFYFGCWMAVAAAGGILFACRGTGLSEPSRRSE